MTLAQRALQPVLRLPSHLHTQLTQTGKLLPSPHQQAVLPHLDALTISLPRHSTALRSHERQINHLTRLRETAVSQPHLLHPLRKILHGHSPATHTALLPNRFFGLPDFPPGPTPPRGVYLHGDVGSGKSLLMDILFACAPLPASRLHFHEFMMTLYQAVHLYDTMGVRERHDRGWTHPLDAVMQRLPTGLLAFDEFQITDVADARLLHGSFERLLDRGTVICFTANRTPDAVNRSQMREEEFKPFLDLLYDSCEIVNVDGVDYRGVIAKSGSSGGCYFGKGDERGLRNAWESVTRCGWDDVVTAEWDVGYGRKIQLERVCPGKAVQISIEELLDRPVGAADYRAIARNTRAIFFSDGLPVFGNDTRNLVRRFVTLVDVAYEEKVRLFMCMDTDLDKLFDAVDVSHVDVSIAEGVQFEGEVGKDGVGAGNRVAGVGNLYTGEDERFAFRRAVSRLREMGTAGFGNVLWD